MSSDRRSRSFVLHGGITPLAREAAIARLTTWLTDRDIPSTVYRYVNGVTLVSADVTAEEEAVARHHVPEIREVEENGFLEEHRIAEETPLASTGRAAPARVSPSRRG